MDPLDGTTAYTLGIPTATFSLGLIVRNEPVLGVIYDPFLDRLYSAVRGHGSFCNGKQIHVNDDDLSTGIVAVASSVVENSTNTAVRDLIAANVRLASLSGAGYKGMLVASGKFAAYIQDWTFPHDVAALHAIISEAGGKVSGKDGGPLDYRKGFRGVLASNGKVHGQILKVVNK